MLELVPSVAENNDEALNDFVFPCNVVFFMETLKLEVQLSCLKKKKKKESNKFNSNVTLHLLFYYTLMVKQFKTGHL